MNFFLDTLSGLLATLISAGFIFVFTNSSFGSKFILKIKDSLQNAEDDKRSAEINKSSGDSSAITKAITSKDYGPGNGFEIQTFYTINEDTLNSVDRLQFLIRDHDNLICTVATKDIKDNIGANIIPDGKGKIRIYLNKEKINDNTFFIRRFGKNIFNSEYELIPDLNNEGLYIFKN